MDFSPDNCHLTAYGKTELGYDNKADFELWKARLKERYLQVLGVMPEKVPLNIEVEYSKKRKGYTEIRFVFESEKNVFVPCHLLLPDNNKKSPSVICLQGHSTGMHISLGVEKYSGDAESIKGDRDFALQAVGRGYAALTVEQRGMGERKSHILPSQRCFFPSVSALLLGRTIIGERVWDISRAIDALDELALTDTDKTACMGNSGGGTVAYYAACFDSRIKIVMPSCSICTYKGSIGAMHHCICNYMPSAAKYFDMGDLAGLIAPASLIILAGRDDEIFPLSETKKSYKTIKEIYKKIGAEHNCRLLIGEGGHRFYAEQAWSVFDEFAKQSVWRR